MTTPFGPQLIGETEKTLNAILLRFLDGTGLTEPQWVTLRVANMLDGTVDRDGLVAAVADRAHFTDAASLVEDLHRARPARRRAAQRRRPGAPRHGAGFGRQPTPVRSSGSSRPTTSPPPSACSTRCVDRGPRRARDGPPRSPPAPTSTAATLDRSLQTGGDDRGRDVAAGALEHRARARRSSDATPR